MDFKDGTLNGSQSTDYLVAQGKCDITVSGLTSGYVTVEILFPDGNSITTAENLKIYEDVYSTLDISEDQVRVRITNTTGNDGVYARVSRSY